MKMQKRRSLATTLRLSILTGVGALGWMALGASGASAAEAPHDAGLLDSVVGVVDSASAPAVSALSKPLSAVAGPGPSASTAPRPLLGGLPVAPDLVAQLPQVLGQPARTVLVPVTSTVDDLVAQVPIVRSVVPAGTVTDVTSPVVGIVDGTVGGVTTPVLEAVAPVTEAISPVVDVVVPLPDLVPPVEAVVPLPDAVAPVAQPVAPALDGAPETAVVPVAPAPVDDVIPDSSKGAVGGVAHKTPRSTSPVLSDGGFDLAARTAGLTSGLLLPAIAGGTAEAAAPVLATIAQATPAVPDFPAAPLAGSSTVLASMTGGGVSAPLAALVGTALLVFILLSGRAARSAAAGLPTSPSFDPGSSPD
ncbi:hypothetical protein [Arthrobacter agilis]|uniref:hypothetical protein n=1 Tax=Arthrobacter agilis TaxID=37921 RepID=UPI002785735F|nr:hypothetical protein [Arthrobacter agilis]MDQ0733916.1 hypothetical protein [Arthrobacter agilis]